MTYYLYHIPGKKIGITKDLKKRVEDQQGYNEDEYDVIMQTDDVAKISEYELFLQNLYGYRVDEVPYNELKFNKKEMNINITEQTTTFPCPVNKLKGQLMDNMGLRWMTEHGEFMITTNTVDWILSNVKESMYDKQRCYVYNKAFARYYDNNDPYNGKTLAGAMGERSYKKDEEDCGCNEIETKPEEEWNIFDYIRNWADERGLYDEGDSKTQALKLTEEVGETCRAILKDDFDEIVDGIGDCVVVLTNLAHLNGVSIEECITSAYDEISKRTGKMVNGTFKKD